MKVGIMQPYVFPYIGYFQLIKCVDKFVFYDDVNFIKKGFINKNYILCNHQKLAFNISCKKISQNKKINETELDFTEKERMKLITTIKHSYKGAPFYNDVFPLIQDFFVSYDKPYISQMAIDSIELVCNYLNFDTAFETSSKSFVSNQSLVREERLINICKKFGANQYINSIGGKRLYDKSDFKKYDIELLFLSSNTKNYEQFDNDFVPWLSIIDVMMFNSIDQIVLMLNNYQLV